MWVSVMWVSLHFEETSNPPQLDSFLGPCRSISFHLQVGVSMGLEVDASIWVCAFDARCRWCQSFRKEMGRRRIVPVCRTNKDHCSPPNGSTFEFVNPISSTSSVNLNPTEANPTAIAPDRDLADVLSWSRSIWSSTGLSVLIFCVRIISITATLVNLGFAMLLRFDFVFEISWVQRLRIDVSAMQVRMRMRLKV